MLVGTKWDISRIFHEQAFHESFDSETWFSWAVAAPAHESLEGVARHGEDARAALGGTRGRARELLDECELAEEAAGLHGLH